MLWLKRRNLFTISMNGQDATRLMEVTLEKPE
jgi:hypothetical protein